MQANAMLASAGGVLLLLLAVQVSATPMVRHDNPAKNQSLWDHPDCKQDIQAARCPAELKDNDLAVLTCLTNPDPDRTRRAVISGQQELQQQADTSSSTLSPPNDDPIGLSDKCQHVIWQYKIRLTNDRNVVHRITEMCQGDVKFLAECLAQEHFQENLSEDPDPKHYHATGHVMSCIIEKKNSEAGVKLSRICVTVITQIEALVFSDYRLTGKFIQHCEDDIEKRKCGRILGLHENSYISQGKVLACLSTDVSKLRESCRKQILKVAEYQSDDYHLDRALFLACRKDRQRICPKVKSGGGRVYECLMKNKQSQEMSPKCARQLIRREQLVAEDFRASKGLAGACASELKKYHCVVDPAEEGDEIVRLSHVLLCLEHAITEGLEENEINGECVHEVTEHRRMLMEEFRMSPEIVHQCRDPIENICNSHKLGVDVIHCLLNLATQRNSVLNRPCEKALATLLKEANVVENWKVDPILQRTCQDVVVAGCDPSASNEAVMSCLMGLAARKSRFMTRECEKTLLEIQYFVARDFALDPKLYRKCRKDASKLCGAQDDWHLSSNQEFGDHKLVFPCLVRYLYPEDYQDFGLDEPRTLSDDCADQVERVLEQRAISVQLHPEIEDSCRQFLVQNCGADTRPGEELECLQKSYDKLNSECREALRTFIQLESKNIVLNTNIIRACDDVIEQNCKTEISTKDEDRVMHCLIELKLHKGDSAIGETCATAIESWQILSLKDWRFSNKFKKVCQKDVKSLCTKPIPKTKSDVLHCLTSIVQEDLLNRTTPPRVAAECRGELKFQLLQKHSDIRLNPEVESNCSDELKTYCHSSRTLECLQRHSQEHKFSKKCLSKIFAEAREAVLQNDVDAPVMAVCAGELESHCTGVSGPNAALNCLKEHVNDVNFNEKCRKIVTERIVQQMRDYRLNPRLQRACQKDIQKYCIDVLMPASDDGPNGSNFMEGKVIQCLKDRFTLGKEAHLTSSCKNEMENILRQATIDIRANPSLFAACPESIRHCKEHVSKGTSEGRGGIEECLRNLFRNKKIAHLHDGTDCIREVAKLVETGSVDIEVDVALHDACGLDVSKFCRDAAPGGGERISCLRAVYEDKNMKLEPKCEKILLERLEMYKQAIQVVPLSSLQDLYDTIERSPHRSYFLLVLMTIVLTLFLCGLFCGRMSRRTAMELKNR